MKTLTSLVVAMLMAFFAMACDSKPPAPPAETPKAEAPKAGGDMALTAEGKKYDPPIKPDALPDGAWYCDMGTVHYARSEKGDNTCPICKMKLTEKTASK